MTEKKYRYTLETSTTKLNIDTTLEVVNEKSFAHIWKRAMKRIKTNLMIKRFQMMTKTQAILKFEENNPKRNSQNKVISRNFIFYPQSPFYLFWLFLVYMSLLYMTTFGIYYTSFIGDDWNSTPIILESIIDIILLFDIIFTANLAVFDDNFKLVFKRKKIFLVYLKTDLILDLISSLPAGLYIRLNPDIHLSRIFLFRHIPKLLKWLVIRDKISNFSFIRRVDIFVIKHSNLVSTVRMIMSFAAIVHVFACLFHLTARYNEFDYTTWVYNTNYGYNLGKGHAYMYATSVHWAMTSISGIGYGDITPYSSLEKGLAMIWMSFGTIFVSLSASQFTSILNNLIKKDLMIDEQMKMVKDFSKSSQLDGVTRNQLKKYIRDQKIVTEKFQIYTAIKNVDDELKYEIATNIYKKAVKRISFLYEKDKSFVADVVFRLEFVKYENHEQIWSKGSYSDGIYFIIGGRVKIFHQGIFFFTYQEGSFFGDLELVLKTERKFEAVAVDTCKCLRMNEEVFEYFKENYPIYYKELKGMQETRKLNILKALTEMVMIFRYRGNLGMINSQSLLETRNELEKELELSKIFVAKNVQIQGFISGLVCFAFYKTRIKSLLKTLLPSSEGVKFEKPVISRITQDQPKLTSENEPENLSLDSISLKSP